jgi:YebC/PmpR family DNA-binding regulatory protein
MAGHSKWANIQHRKGRQDAKRGKIFTRLIKEITVASRMGGGDPGTNPRLRLAMDKAFDNNMPKDTVERAVKRGSGDLEGVNYEEIRYEGYGIGGAAIIVDCMTDNRVRTVAEVRHAFSKYGGNMGTEGSVAFLFKHCGTMLFAPGTDEEKLMEAALEAGADDVTSNADGSFEVITGPYEFSGVKAALEKAGFKAEFGEVTMKATNETELHGEDALKMQKLLDALESLDDTQEVYSSASLDLPD